MEEIKLIPLRADQEQAARFRRLMEQPQEITVLKADVARAFILEMLGYVPAVIVGMGLYLLPFLMLLVGKLMEV